MPFITDRRLRPSRRLLGLGISGARIFHCSSAKSRAWHIGVCPMPCGIPAAFVGGPRRITSGLPSKQDLAPGRVGPKSEMRVRALGVVLELDFRIGHNRTALIAYDS